MIRWQGKNTLVISQDYGSFLALGGIVTKAPLEFTGGMEKDRCGKCRACQEACPMAALDEPYRLKRERCLSHLLSEESLPRETFQLMGNKILDCEICQIVCPFRRLLKTVIDKFGLSARANIWISKVARTIVDREGQENMEAPRPQDVASRE
jgi:epoxyqueuosine reductase